MRKRTVFRRFFLSYLVVLVVPVAIGLALYFVSAQVVKDQSIRLQQSAQEKSVQTMDSYLGQCNENAIQFSFDNDIMALSHANAQRMNSQDIVRMMEAKKKMALYKMDQSFWENFVLIFPESNMFLTKEHVSSELAFFFSDILFYQDYSFEQWLALIESVRGKTVLPMQTIQKNGVARQMLTYLIPMNASYGGSGVMMCLLGDTVLQEMLGAEAGSPVTSLILDEAGSLLYSSNGISPQDLALLARDVEGASGSFEGAFSAGGMLAVYTRSPANGWCYVSLIPTQIALGEVVLIRNITLVIAAAALLVGLLALTFITYRTSTPIQKVVTLLHQYSGQSGAGRDGISLLESGIAELIDTNAAIRENFERQGEILHALYVERLLNGAVIPEGGIELIQRELTGFPVTDRHCCAILIRIREQGEPGSLLLIESIKLLCASLLERDGAVHLLHVLNNNELAVLLAADTQRSLLVASERFCEEFLANLAEDTLSCLLGVGSSGVGIASVRDSFHAARFVVNYSAGSGKEREVLRFEDITPSDTYLYSPHVELQLIGKVRSGNVEETEEILGSIYHSNFEENSLMPYMVKGLLYNLFCTLLKLTSPLTLEQESISNGFMDLLEHSRGDFSAVYGEIRKAFLALARQYEGAKRSHNTDRIQQIKAYIAAHYSESDLDAATIAGAFAITEGYFSQYFKEQTGFTFTAYITNFRISKACALLADTETPIAEVAEQTGYANVYSFRRAFKRVMGTPPSEYRSGGVRGPAPFPGETGEESGRDQS